MKEGLLVSKDFDDFDIEEEIYKTKNWIKFKDRIITEALNEREKPGDLVFKKF